MPARLSLIIALLVGLALGIYATTPPAPRGIDAPVTQFSGARALAAIRVIAARPHPTGSAENAAVRAYIQQRMAALGMEVLTDSAPLSARSLKRLNRWSGRQDTAITLTNVIGILPGKDRSLPAVALMAHHDTVWGSPGAADNTTGVAASLEVVRAIKAAGQPERDLIVLLTDAEELGLGGAEHFFANNPLRNRIGAIINLEARGGGGRANMFQTSRANGEAMRLYATHAEQPAASSLAAFIYSVLPNDTDLTPALKGSYTAYNLAFIGRSGLYHSPLSTPETLDQGSVQDIGNQTLDLAGALLARDGIPSKAPDAVFFDWLGLVTVHYPAGLGWVMLGLAVLGFGWAARRDGAAGLGGGVLRFVGLVIIAGLLTYGFNWISLGGERGEYYDRLAAIPRLEGMAVLACLAAFALVIAPWRATTGAIAGFAAPLVLLASYGQAVAPTAAYVLVVPVLLAGLALAIPAGRARTVASIAAGALVISYMLPLGHFVMQGVGPDMPMAAVLPFVLTVTLILPLWAPIGLRPARLGAGLAAGLAVAIALWVQFDAPAETVAVYAVPPPE
ncbi:MAG: M20/M25/M40 family metallo-hydrolase [Novosphingobium sp.]